MKRSNYRETAGQIFAGSALLTCSLIALAISLLAPHEALAQDSDRNFSQPSELAMPAPHVRRRVPMQRSTLTSMDADRARQALMHSRPRPSRGYVPKHARLANADMAMEPIPQVVNSVGEQVLQEPTYITEGNIPLAPSYADGMMMDQTMPVQEYVEDGYGNEGYSDGGSCGAGGDCGCGGGADCGCGFDCGGGCGTTCDGYCGGACDDMSGYPFGALFGMGNLEVFAGGVGFLGPYNQGDSASFGFQEGFNFGTVLPVFPYSGFGWQIGTRSTQTSLSGSSFTPEERQQTFFTTGVFKRACAGWQGGIVADVLQDEWFAEANVTQLRGELSFRWPCVHEFGYRFSAGLRDDEVVSPINVGQFDTFESFDLHSLFYRRRLTWAAGGQVTVFGGITGNDDGYLGVDAQLPLSDFFSIRSSMSYLVADERVTDGNGEAWNASVMLVFNLRGVRPGSRQAKFTPLLDVAGNGDFILNRVSTR